MDQVLANWLRIHHRGKKSTLGQRDLQRGPACVPQVRETGEDRSLLLALKKRVAMVWMPLQGSPGGGGGESHHKLVAGKKIGIDVYICQFPTVDVFIMYGK